MSRGIRTLVLGLALVSLTGCARGFVLKHKPPGFTTVHRGASELSMRAPNGVELRIITSANTSASSSSWITGGVISNYRSWGYGLHAQAAVESANGVRGTRFDVTIPSDGLESMTSVLFVTDTNVVRVELRGPFGRLAGHADAIDQLVAAIHIRGCKPGRDSVCKGPAPRQYPLSNPRARYVEPSDEHLCAHVADRLRRRLEADPRSKSPFRDSDEFRAACMSSFAAQTAKLDRRAADELTKCVMQADSMESLVRCGEESLGYQDEDECEHVDELLEQAGHERLEGGQCYGDLYRVRIDQGPLAVDAILTCVRAASSLADLERCNY